MGEVQIRVATELETLELLLNLDPEGIGFSEGRATIEKIKQRIKELKGLDSPLKTR